MDIQLFKKDIQSVLADFVDHLQAIQLASIYQNVTTAKPPNLLNFYPQSSEEVEIQRFNLIGEIPSRLNSPEKIAAWLLETRTLIRSQVGIVLTSKTLTRPTDKQSSRDNIVAAWALEAVAKKICSLDVSEGFIEGLRIYLPAVGAITPSKSLSGYEFVHDETRLHTLLQEYCKGHLLYSRSPILSWRENSDSNTMSLSFSYVSILTEICHHIVLLYKSLSNIDRPVPTLNQDFFATVKSLVSRQANMFQITPQVINDLFHSVVSGPCLTPFSPSDKAPSYLFASVIKSGWVNIGFNSDSDVMLKSWIRLTRNALYVFVDQFTVHVQGCIPLEYLRPQLSDMLDTYSNIVLLPVLDKVMPYVAMAPPNQQVATEREQVMEQNDSSVDNITESWSVPEEVTYHSRFVLDIIDNDVSLETNTELTNLSDETLLPSPTSPYDVKERFRQHVEVVGQWLESLEAYSWTCRNIEIGNIEQLLL